MKKQTITEQQLQAFCLYLEENEKSSATLKKYRRDVYGFAAYTAEREIAKTVVLEYKAILAQKYALTSANSMLAALNAFLRFIGKDDCCAKQFKIQQKVFCAEEKELSKQDYFSLIHTAESKNNQRLSLLLQTLCATGMRVSELQYITTDAVQKGEVTVLCKGKVRRIFITSTLRKKLLQYIAQRDMVSDLVFVTKSGKPLDRSNIWAQMKRLSRSAGVLPGKVFPHNLRHLFARTFYGMEKDIAQLADLLGHTNINTTRTYVISTGIEHRQKIENMQLVI